MKTPRYLPLAALIAAAASQVGATDCGQILVNSGFDLWCGDTLCTWQVERGEITRVATWSEGDPGVELLGDDVAISQLTEVTSSDTSCIRFELVADIAENATVELEIDVFGDGSVERKDRLPSSSWAPVSYLIGIRGPYDGVLFRITKTGLGEARLAQIEAAAATGCGGDVIELPDPAVQVARDRPAASTIGTTGGTQP